MRCETDIECDSADETEEEVGRDYNIKSKSIMHILW